jgi:hypothetical protein
LEGKCLTYIGTEGDGENTITANAVSSLDDTATDSVHINAETTGDYITLTSDDESGVFPLDSNLNLEGTFDITEEPVKTYTGPGTVDFLPGEEDNKYIAAIATEGLFFITFEVEHEGSVYTDTVAVLSIDEVVLDTLLKAKWNGMKAALIDGNIEQALNYYTEHSKEKYQRIFNLLGSNISAIASNMGAIELIYANEKIAKYRIKTQETIQGQVYDITYYIYFNKGLDGIWKIESF